MAKSVPITICVLCDWRESSRGKGKKLKVTRYRWVLLLEPQNWCLCIQREKDGEPQEPVGEKFVSRLEHLVQNLMWPAGLDPMDCMRGISEALAYICGDPQGMAHVWENKDSLGRPVPTYYGFARYLDHRYCLNLALPGHDGTYDRLASFDRDGSTIVCNARDYDRDTVAGYSPREWLANRPGPKMIKPRVVIRPPQQRVVIRRRA